MQGPADYLITPHAGSRSFARRVFPLIAFGEHSVMTDDLITLASAPYEELCAPVGSLTYPERSSIECRVLRRMLLRRFPLPPGEFARLVIQRCPHRFGAYRQVAVRYRDRIGAAYALQLESHMPARWDEQACAELIWYSARRLFVAMCRAKWMETLDMPLEYAQHEPPESLMTLLGDPDLLFSPQHHGGPFAREPGSSAGTECESTVFAPPQEALVLGRLDSPLGRGLLVRLERGGLRLYRLDLRAVLAVLSDTLKTRDTFLVRKGSPAESVLTTTVVSGVFAATGRLLCSGPEERLHEVWRISAQGLREAIPISLASGRSPR